MFASKTLGDRNNDPLAWLCPDCGQRFNAGPIMHGYAAICDPRPAYQYGALPENPILVEFRQLRGADWARPERHIKQVAMMLRWIADPDASSEDEASWTADHRAHAHRVLSLLSSMTIEKEK